MRVQLLQRERRDGTAKLMPDGGDAPATREEASSERGRLRAFDPEWIEAMNLLTWIAQYAEGLAEMLDLAGPTIQGELGEILGRRFAALFHPGAGGEETARPESGGTVPGAGEVPAPGGVTPGTSRG
jgi:hypothetical protein